MKAISRLSREAASNALDVLTVRLTGRRFPKAAQGERDTGSASSFCGDTQRLLGLPHNLRVREFAKPEIG